MNSQWSRRVTEIPSVPPIPSVSPRPLSGIPHPVVGTPVGASCPLSHRTRVRTARRGPARRGCHSCDAPRNAVNVFRQWRQQRAMHAARSGASCYAAVDAATCGSVTASARSSPLGRAIAVLIAAPSAEGMRPRPLPHSACRTPPSRAPPRQAWTRHRWRPLPTRATHVARATASCYSAVGAATHGSATASARSSLENISATEAPTAAPPTECRDTLPRKICAPVQLRRDPPRQWKWQS